MRTFVDISNVGVVNDICTENNVGESGTGITQENPYGIWIIIGIIIFTILMIFISIKLFKFFNKDDE